MSALEVDTTHLPLLLQELRLPAVARLWPEFTERSDKEGWPAARLLSALAELEIAERGRRRIVSVWCPTCSGAADCGRCC
jgi:hypothetical protein